MSWICYIKESIGDNSVDGVGLDVGILINVNKWKFGLKTDQIIQTNMTWDTESKPSQILPVITSVGVAKTWWVSRIGTTLDVKFQDHYTPTLHIGLELLPINALAIQLGLNDSAFNMGINLRLTPIEFHVAYQNHSFDAIEDIYKFGLKYQWETRNSKMEAEK